MPSREIVTAVELVVADKLVVADPCYIDADDGDTPETVTAGLGVNRHGVTNLGVVIEDAAGSWTAEVEMAPNDAGRVAKLVLSHNGRFATGPSELVNDCNGVDSGQMMAVCASELPIDYDELLLAYHDEDGNWQSREILGSEGGAVSSTGYGDGAYPVELRRDRDGRPAEVTVTFIGDGDDEEW